MLGKDLRRIRSREAFAKSLTNEMEGKYSQGIAALKKVYDKDHYEMNMRLGWLSYLGGFFIESETYYRRAVTLHPYSIEARFGTVYPLSGLGHWDQIVELYNQILELDPLNYTALYRMGSISYGRKRYKEALKYLDPLLNLYPMDAETQKLVAWTKLQIGDRRTARYLFDKVLLTHPDDESATGGLKALK